jgi:hypothetical protein
MKTDGLIVFKTSGDFKEIPYLKWGKEPLQRIQEYGTIASIMEDKSEVIVRPLFFELNIGAHGERFYHREFRSLDGGPFREYRFISRLWVRTPKRSKFFGDARDMVLDLKAVTIAGYDTIPDSITRVITSEHLDAV